MKSRAEKMAWEVSDLLLICINVRIQRGGWGGGGWKVQVRHAKFVEYESPETRPNAEI